jgi:hypothetical protein
MFKRIACDDHRDWKLYNPLARAANTEEDNDAGPHNAKNGYGLII